MLLVILELVFHKLIQNFKKYQFLGIKISYYGCQMAGRMTKYKIDHLQNILNSNKHYKIPKILIGLA